ncbi:uncharacterized protein LOC141900574 isoform X3 [Tubulanus polymorphus]|uniref:uncharacterized protein LOC141900574 isoform X3 n=1 Tax=Tubulanus polymorphus TaxID=672921 RepID=UPI003DA50EE9
MGTSSDINSVANGIIRLGDMREYRGRKRQIRNLEEWMLLEQLDQKSKEIRDNEEAIDSGEPLTDLLGGDGRKSMKDTINITVSGRGKQDSYEDTKRSNRGANFHVLQAAEEHGRQIATIRNRNLELERQKEDIRRRLEELANRDFKDLESYRTNKVIEDLQDQEKKNSKILVDLKNQMESLSARDNRLKTYPMFPAGSLLAEISALRQAYVDGGGNDPIVLAQLAEMLYEAQNMEQLKSKRTPRRKKKREHNSLADQLIAFEMENQRLQRELLQLQAQEMQKPKETKRESQDEDKFERQMKQLQMEHLQKMQQLQQEMELVRHQLALEKYRRELDIPYTQPTQPPPPALPPRPPDAEIPQLNLLQQQGGGHNQYDNEPLYPSGYDASTGFVIFHDFILNVDAHIKAVRLIVSLYNAAQEMGDPSVLPTTFTEQQETGAGGYEGGGGGGGGSSTVAIIGAKQPVPRCPPQPDMALLIELQMAESTHAKLTTRAWSKIDVFDDQGRVNTGRWRIQLKSLPIKPELSSQEVSTMPPYGQLELYLRLVNHRDADRQSHASITTSHANSYRNPPVRFHNSRGYSPAVQPQYQQAPTPRHGRNHYEQSELVDIFKDKYDSRSQAISNSRPTRPPTTTTTTALIPKTVPPIPPSAPPRHISTPPVPIIETPQQNIETHRSNVDTAPIDDDNRLKPVEGTKDTTVGFQIIRVKNADPGEAKVRLTGYYTNTGKVAQSFTSPLTCSTTAVRSNFKYRYHNYGQQEATFHGVDVRAPIMLVVRLYLRKSRIAIDPDPGADMELGGEPPNDNKADDSEILTAWGAVPLITPQLHNKNRNGHRKFPGEWEWKDLFVNVGTKNIQLYLPPVPNPDTIPLEPHYVSKDWTRYGKADLRLHVFHNIPRPGSVTPSEVSEDEDNDSLIPPEVAWISFERKMVISEQFGPSDGFDLYIDGCRFLPDSVTITRVAGRILTRRYEMVGRDITTIVRPDSYIYNPKFEHKMEFREPNIPPSSTLLLKVYTIDRFSNKLTVVGYTALNIFVETGTEKQPSLDEGGQQVSLNEGAHQLRLYHFGPNGSDPLTEGSMRDAGVRIIPCASLLVRLIRAPIGHNGLALTGDKIPEKDWARYGLWVPRPRYSDRVYLSRKCEPTRGERMIFKAMLRRPQVSIAEAVEFLSGKKITGELKIEQFMRNQLTKLMDTTPQDQDMTFISKYDPQSGIKVAIDTAMNLPWSGFTHAVFCLNPPGAFYMGAPHASYDKPQFTSQLDLYSTNKSPTWKDGFRHFQSRSYHRYLCVIIHLQEISVSVNKENYKYGLLEQGWTAVQVFNDMYANTQIYQLPVFHGSPTQSMLKLLAREPCIEFVQRGLQNGSLKLLEGASLFVRLCDARRDEELTEKREDDVMELSTEYIPLPLYQKYTTELPGQQFIQMIPPGRETSEFTAGLAAKFKSLVYKLYEEGNLNV